MKTFKLIAASLYLALAGSSASAQTATKWSSCFCQAGCFYGTGDSFHFDQTVDVDCGLSTSQKKEKVIEKLMVHYMQAHTVDKMSVAAQNVQIKCYGAN